MKSKEYGFLRKCMMWVICVGLVVGLIIGIQSPVKAAQTVNGAGQTETVLRVAYCPLEGFFDYDQQGNEVGYGVELLDKISQYTGIRFEYVKTDSWEKTKYMLLNGEADIRMPGTMPATPSTTLSYSSTSILDTYEVMMTLDSREDLYYQDYDTIQTLKIAITDSFYQAEEVEKYLDDIGITESQLVFFSEYNECYQQLKDGKVDALISNIMDMSDDLKMLARFNSISNYISMVLNSPYMNTINDAIAEIKLDEPMFLSNLYEKWFPERTTVPLTLEESRYLSSLDTLTFAFRKNEGYLAHYRDGEYYGIYVDQAKLLCKKLGKQFRAVSIDDCLSGQDTADVYTGFFYDRNYAKMWEFGISAPVKDINYYIIQKKEENFDPATSRIAAIQKFKYTSDYLERQYPDADFQYFDTYEDCLKAVEAGKADMTIINNYIAEYYLGMYQFSDLSVQLSNDYSHMYCFATSNNNEMMASILTKALSMVTESEMSGTYISGQSDKPESYLLRGLLYRSPGVVIGGTAAVAALIIAIVLLLLFQRKSQRQNQALEQALSAKSSFLARMSHDMRTPLNVIIGMERLASENANPEDTSHCLGKIGIASEFLLGLINDILDLEKADSGKTELHLIPYSGEEFSQYIDAVISPLCEQKSIDFEYSYDGSNDFVIMQDKLKINQIYFNLLSNAVKFTPEGGKIRFHTDFEKTDHNTIAMVVTISDTGIGMSEEFQEHMFEPFSQENQVVTPVGTGTGLGLTIVKRMCDLMHMTIVVSSQLGAGTTFTLTGEYELAEKCAKDEKGRKEKDEAIDEQALENRMILVCEDHPLNQEIIRRILEKKGMIVTIAEDGKKGVEAFSQSAIGTYAAVLMDIRMPVMDGLEATKEIRGLQRSDAKSIPIIALTANAYEEDIRKCLDAGMNGHLTKPVEPEDVYQMLGQHIQ